MSILQLKMLVQLQAVFSQFLLLAAAGVLASLALVLMGCAGHEPTILAVNLLSQPANLLSLLQICSASILAES